MLGVWHTHRLTGWEKTIESWSLHCLAGNLCRRKLILETEQGVPVVQQSSSRKLILWKKKGQQHALLWCLLLSTASPAACTIVRDIFWCHYPVWKLRAVIWFPFPVSSVVFLTGPLALFVLSFSVNAPSFWLVFRKFSNIFLKEVFFFCVCVCACMVPFTFGVFFWYCFCPFLFFIFFLYYSLTWHR